MTNKRRMLLEARRSMVSLLDHLRRRAVEGAWKVIHVVAVRHDESIEVYTAGNASHSEKLGHLEAAKMDEHAGKGVTK